MASDIAKNVRSLPVDGSVFPAAEGIYCATAGNVQFTTDGGGQSPVIAVTAGQILPWSVVSLSASTTATCLALD